MAMLRPAQAVQTGAPGFVRGLLSGFVPLAALLAGMAVSFVITYGDRLALASRDFAVQQLTLPLVLGACLLVTIVTYAWTTVRTWRLARVWRQDGEVAYVRGAYLALALTGVLILLPFVLAIMWPQSPAVAK